jgi:hypothetical protein
LAARLQEDLEKLIGGQGVRLEFGYQHKIAGEYQRSLASGYAAFVDTRKAWSTKLCVIDGELRVQTSDQETNPYPSDYLLFRLDQRQERDDWQSLGITQELANHVLEAAAEENLDLARQAYLGLAFYVSRNWDLTVADQRRILSAVRRLLDERKAVGLSGAASEILPPSSLRGSGTTSRDKQPSRAARTGAKGTTKARGPAVAKDTAEEAAVKQTPGDKQPSRAARTGAKGTTKARGPAVAKDTAEEAAVKQIPGVQAESLGAGSRCCEQPSENQRLFPFRLRQQIALSLLTVVPVTLCA